MSRSIHTTKRHLAERRRMNDSNKEVRKKEIAQLKAELTKKTSIKYQVSGERRRPELQEIVSPDVVPIFIEDEGPALNYAASVSDLYALLHRLPQGVTGGLSSITLCAGEYDQEEQSADGDRDPHLGRVGIEIFPGVYSGEILGVYHEDTALIRLFAYVYQNDLALLPIKEIYLKAAMLSTLAHEVAHHDDFQRRIARGRWRADNTEKKEIYAESMEHDWQTRCVLPLLEERYPDELARLLSWVEIYGGSLAPGGPRQTMLLLLGDPRQTLAGGLQKIAFVSVRGALSNLMDDVEGSLDGSSTAIEYKIGFARDLHYEGHYDWARLCLARVLTESPEDAEALTLIADIDVHEEKFEDAEVLCKRVLSVEPERIETLEVLADSYEARALWAELLDVTACILSQEIPPDYTKLRALRQRASALFSLQRAQELGEVVAALRLLPGKLASGAADAAEAMWLLQTGALEEAQSFATRALGPGSSTNNVLLTAVRFEAAQLLQRPEDVGELSTFFQKRLYGLGFGAWVARLAVGEGSKRNQR